MTSGSCSARSSPAGWPTPPGYSPAFVLCAVVCVLPVFAVLASPETLQRDHAATGVKDPATDATDNLVGTGCVP